VSVVYARENEEHARPDDPEQGRERCRDPEERDPNHEETGVELLLVDRLAADLDRFGRKLVDRSEPSEEESEREEEQGVGEAVHRKRSRNQSQLKVDKHI
jgi:hypothetical protein